MALRPIHFFVCQFMDRDVTHKVLYLKPKPSSDKIRKKTLYEPDPVYILLYGPAREQRQIGKI